MEKELTVARNNGKSSTALEAMVYDPKQNTGPFCELKSGVTITMGGDGKSHEIPDELWQYIDVFTDSYKRYKDSDWHKFALYDAEIDMALAIWNNTYGKEKEK